MLARKLMYMCGTMRQSWTEALWSSCAWLFCGGYQAPLTSFWQFFLAVSCFGEVLFYLDDTLPRHETYPNLSVLISVLYLSNTAGYYKPLKMELSFPSTPYNYLSDP